MELHNKNWITCTPIAFRGDKTTFFSRDSGLCCRALQALGANAKAVMPEPAWDDEPDVLRVPFARLSDPEFWRAQGADAVILYSWAAPKYTSIAEAIHAAGVKLFLNIDSEGLISPFVEPMSYIRLKFSAAQRDQGFFRGSLTAFCNLMWQYIGLHRHLSRVRHMAVADVVGLVSPIAAERFRKYVHFLGRPDLVHKIQFVSHPIDDILQYKGCVKTETILAIGRWNDSVKRPELLIDVAERVLRHHPTAQFIIVGKDATRCVAEIAARVPFAQGRLTSYESLSHEELRSKMTTAQISLCTSRSEGYHLSSGEALLAGCSVVSPRAPALPSLAFFIYGGLSGRLSENNADALAEAVIAELEVWKSGERDAWLIARSWQVRISAEAVVQQIDKLLS